MLVVFTVEQVCVDPLAAALEQPSALLGEVVLTDVSSHILLGPERARRVPFWWLSLGLGLTTMVATLALAEQTSVFTLAVTSISLMAAGLAPAVAIKVLRWRHTALSLTVAVGVGFCAALAWKIGCLSGAVNEAAIGISLGLLANYTLRWRGTAANNSREREQLGSPPQKGDRE